MRFFRQIWYRIWHPRDIFTGIKELDGIMAKITKFDLKYSAHYEDCHDYGKGILRETGCWCQHRGASSHYGGSIGPGWHREKCPKVGLAWIVTWNSTDNQWWEQPKCECQAERDWGGYILTLKDGTVHGPPPGPIPPGVAEFFEKFHGPSDAKDKE